MVFRKNPFKQAPMPKGGLTPIGQAGYDNPRENIDPHLRTKAIDTKEIIQEGVSYDLSTFGAGGGGGDSFMVSGATTLTPKSAAQGLSGASIHSGATAVSLQGHSHTLDTIENPEASKTFNFGNNKSLTFTSVDNSPTAGEGTFNFQATGAYTGDLVHIHQHTGNPGAGTHLLHLEATDADVTPVLISGASSIGLEVHNGIVGFDFISGAAIYSGAKAVLMTETDPVYTRQSGAFITSESWPTQSGAYVQSGAMVAHLGTTTDPHGVNIIQTSMSGANIINTGDHNTSAAAYIVGVITSDSANPPTASGFPQGTIFLQYTA